MIGSLFGTDPAIIKFLNELGDSVNSMNQKLTLIVQNSNSMTTLLHENNELLREISKELIDGKLHVSYDFAYKQTNEKSNKKVKIDLNPKMHLDEIIEIKIKAIQDQIHDLTRITESIQNRI